MFAEDWMKWAVFALALAGVLPLAVWIRGHPKQASIIYMLMGLAPFVLSSFPGFSIAVISWKEWPGFVKGAQVSALDLFALAIYLGLPRAGRSLPFRFSMAFYFLTVLLSVFQAGEPAAALFYVWQLGRMFLIYAVVTRSCEDERFIPFFLTGIAIGLCFEASIVIWQKFVLGESQPTGTLVHQNALGFLSNLVALPFLVLLLIGYRSWTSAAAVLAGAVIAALTASRATAGMAALGCLIIFIQSTSLRWTPRKALVGFAGLVTIVVLVPLALPALQERFAKISVSNYDERDAYKDAAAAIIADHPAGIGANNFSFFSFTEGYLGRSRVATNDISASPHVHNVYWLAAAETGYLGLAALMIFLLRSLIVAFRCGWRNRGDRRGELLFGLGTSLLMACIHSYYEWVLFTFYVQYVFAMTVGMIAGLAQQLGYWRRVNVRGRRLSRGQMLRRPLIDGA